MGIKFNGVHCSSFGLEAKITRPLLPENNDTYTDVPGRAGSVLFPGKPQDRNIQVDFGFMPGSRVEFRDRIWEISAWLYTADRKPLIFDDELNKAYRAKVEGQIDLEQAYLLGQFSVTFRSDPFAYGTEITRNFDGNTVTVNNNGSYETCPAFDVTFTAVATEWKVTLGTKYIRVVHDFAIADTLHIDAGTGAILLNGSRAMNKLDWQYSQFFNLAVGENSLSITPVGVCTATVKYTPRWL
jgi:putative phage tail component, N-terminal domain